MIMKLLPVFAALFALTGSQAVAASPAMFPDGYSLYKSIGLDAKSDGMAGTIQVLEDARITPYIRKELDGTGTGMTCDGPDDKPTQDFCASLQGHDPRPAIVRLLGADGQVFDSRTFERELGDISADHLYDDARVTYLVTVDMSVGAGSYAGPATMLMEISAKRFKWLQARDIGSGEAKDIVLANTLKTVWKIVPVASGKDILMAATRLDYPGNSPVGADDVWQVHYYRYHCVKGQWLIYSRVEKGYDEFEDFPETDKFPAP
jgi:hypothetical protein